MASKYILVLGGARSGKSRYAEELAGAENKVLYVATAEAKDEEMQDRIARHRQNRPAGWETLEAASGVGKAIASHAGEVETVIVDCITLLVNNAFAGVTANPDDPAYPIDEVSETIFREICELLKIIHESGKRFIVVSNELGSGVVPANPLGRWYRDLHGLTNQMLAKAADEVYLLVAGIPVKVK